MKMKIKETRYIWLPVLLFIYGAAIGIIFGPDFVRNGRTVQLILTLAGDLFVCVMLFLSLRKKKTLEENRP